MWKVFKYKNVYVYTILLCSLPTHVDEDNQFNGQLCSPKAVSSGGVNYEELKSTCEKFQRFMGKTNSTEEQLKQKKRQKTIDDMLTNKNKKTFV